MKKISLGYLLAVLVLVILAAMFAYMSYQASNQQNKLDTLQATITKDSQTVSGVVNFINTGLANTQATQ